VIKTVCVSFRDYRRNICQKQGCFVYENIGKIALFYFPFVYSCAIMRNDT